jgi:hypothetical protein
MLGGIEHDYTGVLCFGEVMTADGIVSMVQWRHPDGRRFSATGDSLMTAMAMAMQMEKTRLEIENPPMELHPTCMNQGECCGPYDGPCPRQKEKCPQCGSQDLLQTKDGDACPMCSYMKVSP